MKALVNSTLSTTAVSSYAAPVSAGLLLPGWSPALAISHSMSPASSRAQLFRSLVEKWRCEDSAEQRATLALLERSLNENRPGQRRIFG